MDERFLRKVAPPILYVLSVLEKIESSGGEAPPPAAIRPRIKQLVGPFNVRGHEQESHNLAKSAIVFWIDEVLVNAGWKFASEWQNNPLELELYGTRSRAWRFFENAADARSLETSDALEVFALCVANGFEGVYRSEAFDPETFATGGPSKADLIELGAGAAGGTAVAGTGVAVESRTASPDRTHVHRLPGTLDEWTASVFQQLLEERIKPFETKAPYDSVRTAKPLTSLQSLVRWGLVLGATVAITLALLLMWGV